MIIISGREFRANESHYLDMVDSGQQVILRRRGAKSYRIVPIKEDDTLMTEEEYYAKLDRSIKQAEEGKVITINTPEEMHKFFDDL